MCGRYAFFSPAEAVRRTFEIDELPPLEPRYNIAPTQPVPVLRATGSGGRKLGLLRWGLIPSWAKDPSIGNRMINARGETLTERPAYRSAYRRRRCILPADGWYEWQAAAAGRQPWFIRSRNGMPLGLAGLWESWRDPETGEAVESCTIVTTDAAEPIASIHGRMPVVLPAEAHAAWLDPELQDPATLGRWLAPCEPALSAFQVSRRVNNPRNEGPDLIEALPPA